MWEVRGSRLCSVDTLKTNSKVYQPAKHVGNGVDRKEKGGFHIEQQSRVSNLIPRSYKLSRFTLCPLVASDDATHPRLPAWLLVLPEKRLAVNQFQ